jgi:cytochrome c
MRSGLIAAAGAAAALAAMLTIGGSGATAQQIVGHAAAGAEVFKKCLPCHRVGVAARNGVGPILNGLLGRKAGTYPGYTYSEANKNSGLVWDTAILMKYLKEPMVVVPETKMNFPGLATDQDAADVIAYLATFNANGTLKPVPSQ